MEGVALFTFLSVSTVARHWYRRYHKPRLFYRLTAENKKRVERCDAVQTYVPPPLPDYYGHVHSALCHILRGAFQFDLKIERELLTLSDGGTVGLDWVDRKPVSISTEPVVILFHGICGNSKDSHIVYAARTLRKAGFDVVTFICRGCGGVPLTTPASFNVSLDLTFVLFRVLVQCAFHIFATGGTQVGFKRRNSIYFKGSSKCTSVCSWLLFGCWHALELPRPYG